MSLRIFPTFYRHSIGLACALLFGLCALSVKADTVTVNFRDAEIESVIESIAALTGGTFIVDPRVKGKMTIVSPEPVEADLLYEVFLSALQVHGFQAVNDGAAIRIVPLARSINVPTGRAGNELTTEVIPLNYVAANEMVPILKPLMSQGAHLGAHPSSNVLVMTDTKSQVRRVKKILARMDSSEQKGFDVIAVNHSSAGEIVGIAREMGILTGQSKVVEDSTGNRIIVSGPQSSREQLKALVRALDTQSDDNSGIDVINLNYSDAETIQPILESMLKSKAFLKLSGEGTKQDNNAYTVQADKENNALIIAAPTGVTAAIKSIIKKLDKPRSQVLIEAVIAEVSEDFVRNLSVNLIAAGSSGALISDFTGSITGVTAAAIQGTVEAQAAAIAAVTASGNSVFGGGKIDSDGNGGLAGIIEAIKTDTRNTVLSTPSILTLENEEALISIGEEVPFATGSFTTSGTGASNPFQTIEREEVGTILRVTPQINESDSVRLEINQEVSSISDRVIAGGGAGTDVVTDKKVIETNVLVENNQLLVLGGLMDKKFSNTEKRVPLLGDIPLFGRLFRSSSKTIDTTVLVVFIRPTIIRNAAEGDAVSGQKYKLLQGIRSEFIERNNYEKYLEQLPATIDDVNQVEDLLK